METLQTGLKEIDLGPDSLLHFVHIPKTAGTSMRGYVDSFYFPNEILPAEAAGCKTFDMVDRSACDRFHLVRGHHTLDDLGPVFENSGHEVVRFTVLREPADRLVSEYNMILHNATHPLREEFLRDDVSFDRFLSHPKVPWVSKGNTQARVILVQMFRSEDLPPESEWYDVLVDLFQSYAVVGVTESFDMTTQLMAYVFGRRTPSAFRTGRVVLVRLA